MTSPGDRDEVLLVWGDDKNRRALYKILAATGAQVRFADKAGGAVSLEGGCRLVVMDYDSMRSQTHAALAQLQRLPNPPPVLVITSGDDTAELVDLFSHTVLTNLFAKNSEVVATELIVTAQKLARRNIFGLEKYLTWGVEPIDRTVTSSEQRREVIAEMSEYLQGLGANSRLVGLAGGVADEFLMNAIYSAPVDPDGNPKYASLPRSERVDLEPSEAVLFRYACDGRQLALSVSDSFGRLERETVLSYLRRCFKRGEEQIEAKTGGAGLGLYYSFQALNHLVINVQPGVRTEMIGLLDISGSFKDFAKSAKSLHLFFDRSVP